ncbi:MAG: hypothetical protein GY854_01645 [Deltaproteobacteria bacterium]|nr:hypothetical protein [Deltaproteobacteria bacterium]
MRRLIRLGVLGPLGGVPRRRKRIWMVEIDGFGLAKKPGCILRSQIATSKIGRGGRRYAPYVFTEHGAVMLANVLRSPVAVQASIQVVRAFVSLREMLASHEDLAKKLNTLEKKYDKQFSVVFQAIQKLMEPSKRDRRRIGFGKGGEKT